MTKKKIRYSDFTAADVTPAAAVTAPPVPAPAPLAAAVQQPTRSGGVVVGRLTPMGGSVVVQRKTPMGGSDVVPRTTPLRGTATIVRVAKPDAPPGETASPSLRERARLRHGTVELLVFAVGSEWFGIELARVEEAIDLPTVRHIPEMPPAMLGVTTVRNSLTAVYAPAAALGLMSGGHASALVFRRERGRLGIAVDDVDDVHTLDLADLRDAPGIDAADGILLGVLRYRDGLLALVDAESLITACQAVPEMEIA